MKLRACYVTHMDGDDQLMVDTSLKFSGIIRNNCTAAFLVDCLKTETTEVELVEKLLERYDVSEEVAARDVRAVVDKLRSIGAIDE